MATELGLWLRDQRQARGWSAAEMARRIQRASRAAGDTTTSGAILATYIRRWERGLIAPTERYALHCAQALGISPAQFGPPQPHMSSRSRRMPPALPSRASGARRPGLFCRVDFGTPAAIVRLSPISSGWRRRR
jgi:transcriptional regulator with XRE-family HTH domain